MTDTYENKQAWERTVSNARQAGVLDKPGSVAHIEAVTLAEKSAKREQDRVLTRKSIVLPPGAYDRIFKKGER